MKPREKVPVFILLKNGEIHEGHWIKDINKYKRNVKRWRIYKTGKTVPDEEVLMWIYPKEFLTLLRAQKTLTFHCNMVIE